MKNDRVGEWLWEEWDGEGYDFLDDENIAYVTYDHIDVNEEIVRRALASCMQRDGVSDSLSDSFRMIESSRITSGFVGFLDDERYPVVVDSDGETADGDIVPTVSLATWVECPFH